MIKYTLSITIFFLSFQLLSQTGTSLEEYRYLTKGYAYQLEMGLDAQKDGYVIRKLYRSKEDIQFVGLYKRGEQQLRALLAIIGVSSTSPKYLCIPKGETSEEVQDLFTKQKSSILAGYSLRNQYENALAELLMRSLDQPLESLPYDGRKEELLSRNDYKPVIELTPKGIPINQQPEQPVSVERSMERQGIPDEMDYTIPASEEKINEKIVAKIGGDLTERTLIQAPQVRSSSVAKGKVVLKVCVDQRGEVVSAKFTQLGSTTFNKELKKIAVDSARSIYFAKSDLPQQCGLVSYHFK